MLAPISMLEHAKYARDESRDKTLASITLFSLLSYYFQLLIYLFFFGLFWST
jgi:hypothetical protein